MANVKLIEFIPTSGALGVQIINFEDAPAGLSFTKQHVSPRASRRTQDGALIVQAIRYNKKVFDFSFGLHDIPLKTYIESLLESGVGATLKVWYEDSTTFVATLEFNAVVELLGLTESMDQSSNVRTLTLSISEV